MPSGIQRTKPSFAPGQRSGHLGLVTLIVLPLAGCFAEPKPQTTAGPSGGGTSGTSQTTGSSGGHHASGGRFQGGSGGDTSSSAGEADRGGSPDVGGSTGGTGAGATGGLDAQEGSTSAFKCHGAVAQPLPARKAVTSKDAPPPAPPPTVSTFTKLQLFTSFQQNCGVNSSCHIGSGDPNAEPNVAFKVTLATFDQRKTLGDDAMERVTSSDPASWMPPSPWSAGSAKPGTTIYDLAAHLQEWQQKGFPDSFTVPVGSTSTSQGPTTNEKPYLLSTELAQALTNIGSCVPDKLTDAVIMQDPVVQEMQQKDAFFAGLQTSDDLPDTIYETDLVTLDSTALAQRRVFSYAPTYPLYSDNAGKMRYVRVPLGETIHYDETLHDFTIPDNTRFYKTFLKPIKDKDGNVGYRKMETRVIVVRQDSQNSDGSYTTHALRASYAWDADEQMAHRVKDPFRDGTAARDRLCSYITDESVTRDPSKNPISPLVNDTCQYMTADQMNDPSSGAIRHYAIPSTQRCDQCHMGSSSHSFVLGFTPWQVDRRKSGEGGLYEQPNTDELTQLQRFLDYGIVDGIEPGQVKLEESQLIADPPRSPRNDYELTAQGYMLGNCAFCHNPHGYPVVTNPVLKEFELFPSETGGIFQFPLDKYSPRAKAMPSQDKLIPYIAPTFGDFQLPTDVDYVQGKDYQPGKSNWMSLPQDQTTGAFALLDYQSFNTPDLDPLTGHFRFVAPWRSLIWRNVYTPFTYTDHSTIYIHMPRNVAGFDCRLPNIMAKWMLSIPVTRDPELQSNSNLNVPVDGVYDGQPTEITGDDPSQAYAYGQAVQAAAQRVDQYEHSVVGQWCPADDDIVDPMVISSVDPTTGTQTLTTPIDQGFPPGARVNPVFESTATARASGDGVPSHAHWISLDTTETPGKWVPRRPNWQDYLVKRDLTVPSMPSGVIDDLQNVHLTDDLQKFALDEVPMGIWAPSCQTTPEAQGTATASQLRNGLLSKPDVPFSRWLMGQVFDSEPYPSDADHIHFQSRGEGVFRAICQNCHGPQIDSKSALAATIQELTGGATRVANFVAGLFGPPTAPGAYAQDEFLLGDGLPSADWQVRYVLFMGLGGTGAYIPQSALNLVATSSFYGHAVAVPGVNSPNMLGSAQQLCFYVLADPRNLGTRVPDGQPLTAKATAVAVEFGKATTPHFVPGVGHYELWESLCATGNDPVVHVFAPDPASGAAPKFGAVYRAKDDGGNWIYPPDAPVGNERGNIETGVQTTNLWPWCVQITSDQDRAGLHTWASSQSIGDAQIPVCPPSIFASVDSYPVYQLALDTTNNKENSDPKVPFNNADFTGHWLRHGAINAGMSAFYFMRGFAEHTLTPDQPFDFCTQ